MSFSFETEDEALSNEALFGRNASRFGREYEQEGEFEWEALAPPVECKRYEPGEVQKSYTEKGHLSTDVISHSRGLLVADLGVDSRTPRPSLKNDQTLRAWLTTLLQVIASNPTTTIRISGFSDCVGNERHNKELRRGRAFKMGALLKEMLGGGAQWNSFNSRVVMDGAPIGEYIASNATVEGRAQNRSVLIEHFRKIKFEGEDLKACQITPALAADYPLVGVIPNDPNYQKYIPIEYKLDAKKMIGKLAQDVMSGRHTLHKWLEGAHFVIVGMKIFMEASAVAGALAIGAPVIGMVANFMALGMGCADAAEAVATNWCVTGYSRGVIMGAKECPASMVKDFFLNEYFQKYDQCPNARDVGIANYKLGLLVGYVHGRMLCPNQRTILLRDLDRRMGGLSLPDPKTWGRRPRRDFLSYASAAGAFRKYHLM